MNKQDTEASDKDGTRKIRIQQMNVHPQIGSFNLKTFSLLIHSLFKDIRLQETFSSFFKLDEQKRKVFNNFCKQ